MSLSSRDAKPSGTDADEDTLLRSPLVPSMVALEEGACGAAASPKAPAAPVDRYHLAYAIFYLQVRSH